MWQVLSDGAVDAAIQTPAFTSRWDNYWVEGILWLAKNIEIDGARRDRAAIAPRSGWELAVRAGPTRDPQASISTARHTSTPSFDGYAARSNRS